MNKSLINIVISIIFVLSFASCFDNKKSIPKTGRLEQMLPQVRDRCDIPMEWPHSWPIPTGGKSGHEFRILFYPMVSGDSGEAFTLYNPQGIATFNIHNNTISGCGLLKKKLKALSSRRWPEGVSGICVKEFLRLQGQLYEATEEAAVIYAAKKELTPAEQKKIRGYGTLFNKLAEPALLSYYYELNPDFWEWLRLNGAESLKK